ncbi:hypothetical protein HFP43_01340 [Streptomyces sp. SJ1-7]|nr:hypothetical protein [Streptomyces sp. SJ1-7]
MSRTESFLDNFEVRSYPVAEGHPDNVVTDTEAGAWIPAVVPGGVHESLMAAGLADHPFIGANEHELDWVQEREWWYRTRFPHPGPGTARLVFDGLDTVADIWLNGWHLGHHENQFRPAAFDVTDALGEDNTLLVRFLPPLLGREPVASAAETIKRMLALMNPGDEDDSADTERADASGEDAHWTQTMPVAASLRKAAFSWGWDFGPHVPSIGIWRQVRLEVAPGATLTGHHVALAQLAEDHSTARVQVTVETSEPGTRLTAHVTLRSPSGREFRTGMELESSTSRTELSVDKPELWWTHDLGKAALHQLVIELWDGDVMLDTVTDSVGLRTLELNRAPDEKEGGRHFGFVLNGVPLFARGANWLPASSMIGSVDEATHRDLVLRATEGNLTMLRVWGGGIYEHDSFYRACDELGVLVWQDFMFANVDYPDRDPDLRHEVQLEAEYQVRRLRNRACLALWCGNNEALMMRALVWGIWTRARMARPDGAAGSTPTFSPAPSLPTTASLRTGPAAPTVRRAACCPSSAPTTATATHGRSGTASSCRACRWGPPRSPPSAMPGTTAVTPTTPRSSSASSVSTPPRKPPHCAAGSPRKTWLSTRRSSTSTTRTTPRTRAMNYWRSPPAHPKGSTSTSPSPRPSKPRAWPSGSSTTGGVSRTQPVPLCGSTTMCGPASPGPSSTTTASRRPPTTPHAGPQPHSPSASAQRRMVTWNCGWPTTHAPLPASTWTSRSAPSTAATGPPIASPLPPPPASPRSPGRQPPAYTRPTRTTTPGPRCPTARHPPYASTSRRSRTCASGRAHSTSRRNRTPCGSAPPATRTWSASSSPCWACVCPTTPSTCVTATRSSFTWPEPTPHP